MEKNLTLIKAAKLYKLRRDANLKQDVVANALNKSQQSYSKLERGEVDFTDEVIDDICNYFKISRDEFIELNSGTNCINSPNSATNVYNSNNIANNINEEIVRSFLEELKSMREERIFFMKSIEKILIVIEKEKNQ